MSRWSGVYCWSGGHCCDCVVSCDSFEMVLLQVVFGTCFEAMDYILKIQEVGNLDANMSQGM